MAKYVYPEMPKTVSGYTDEWIKAYFSDKANKVSPAMLRKYIANINGKSAAERKKIFADMFINRKVDVDLFAILKQLQDDAKAEKEEAKKAAAQQEENTEEKA